MYEPFPGNYAWNLAINICLGMGGAIGEIDQANQVLRSIAEEGADKGTEAFFRSWGELADRLIVLGEEAESMGHAASASEKYCRASAYYLTAERMQSRHYAPRAEMYGKMLNTIERAITVGDLNCQRVQIAFSQKSFPALFVKGHGEGPHPCMIFCNGLDSTKEMIFLTMRQELAKRGVSCLMVDQPGAGEALRIAGLTAIADSEKWAGACIDYLESRSDVDRKRIGMMGWSLGGYYAPRAAAYEKRLALCVAWGANHNWGEVQQRRLAREGDRPVPHYWDHVMWVWGYHNMDEFMRFIPKVSLTGHLNRITVPFLITHGANDRQIPLEYAQQSYDEAINSPDRELKVFTSRDGGVEHVGADNIEPVRSYICDWIADRFQPSGY